jgi:putative MFS transporter
MYNYGWFCRNQVRLIPILSFSATLLVEYAPSTKRSSLYALYQVFWVIGSIYVYVTAMLVVPYYGWRLLAILSALPALIVALSVYVNLH